LDVLLPDLDGTGRATVGREAGALAARLAQMPMPRAGFFADGDLRVRPWPDGDLPAFVASRRAGTALSLWPDSGYAALLGVAETAQTLLDRVTRTTLVHGDLNPKNVLVDPDTLAVTGLVDWEFAHAGGPISDLGNLLRFDRDPAFAQAVLETYRHDVVDAPDDVLDLARAADLYALVDLAARRGENPVTEQAHVLLGAIARSGDLHATP
ncbi:MAG: phosphotransferase, partial [Nocardioidaceae bacterium]|nr:phosphotransferase [Nocardioidaceae bacterium]